MLITVLLLIAGFLLTSTMLAHYQIPTSSEKETVSPLNLSLLTNLFRNQTTGADQPESSKLNTLFSEHDLMSHWPRLKLSGFGRSEEDSGNFAIINGKKVHPGQLITGKVKLVEIRDHDVLVTFKGETKILTIAN